MLSSMKTTLPRNVVGLAALLLLACVGGSLQSPAEDALLRQLFTNYEASSRPVAGGDQQPLLVDVGFEPTAVDSVDVGADEMSLHGWLQLGWNDVQLRWDPAAHGGVDRLNVDVDRLWRPDVRLYNALEYSDVHTLAIVYSTGKVLWVPPVSARVRCSMSATWFPFDEQRCRLVIGSWTYEMDRLDLTTTAHPEINVNKTFSSEWRLLSVQAERTQRKYPCCKELYPSVEVELTLRRRPCRFVSQLFAPVAMLTTLSMFSMLFTADRFQLRLLVATILIGISLLLVHSAGMFGQPEQLSALSVVNGFLLLIQAGVMICSCIQLGLQRCPTVDRPIWSLTGMSVSRCDGSLPQEKSDALLTDGSEPSAASALRQTRSRIDRMFVLPLACLELLCVCGFLAIPLFRAA